MTISQSCGLIKNLQHVCSPVQPVCGPGHPPTCRRRHQAANCGRHCTATDANHSAREVRRESQRCYARRSAQQPPQRPRHPLRQSRRRGGAQGARGGGCATLPAWAVPQASSEVACRPKRPRCAARPAQRHGGREPRNQATAQALEGERRFSVRGLPLAVDGIPAHRPARTQARTLQDWTEKNQKACVQSGRAPDAARSPQSNEQKSTPEVN